MLQTFDNVGETAQSLAAMGCVSSEQNQNLTHLQRALLQWHHKLGHIGFETVQWIGRQGWLGQLGEKAGGTNVKWPKCAACQFGKQERNSKGGSKEVRFKDEEGALKRGKVEPGDLVFTDQFESRFPGRVFGQRGSKITAQKYKGGTVFCDAATRRVKISPQISFTANETISSKLQFEREALSEGVTIKNYSSDNGIYVTKEYTRELHEKNQGMHLSGVGGHHHNGVAENTIKNVV